MLLPIHVVGAFRLSSLRGKLVETFRKLPNFHRGGPRDGKCVTMERAVPLQKPWGALVVSRYVGRDTDPPHDHPRWFVTFVFAGAYAEEVFDESGRLVDVVTRTAPWIGFRPMRLIHRVQPIGSAWSVMWLGPERRKWSLYPPDGSGPISYPDYYRTGAPKA